MTELLRIVRDPDPMNPRDWDNIGTIVTWHRRYQIGETPKCSLTDWKAPKGSVVLPVYMLDHSGVSFSTEPFHDPWDSGQLGFIYATPKKIQSGWGWKRLNPKRMEILTSVLKHEIKVYDQYQRGDAWGFTLIEDGEEKDSCWGFYGDTLQETGILDYLTKEQYPLAEQAWVHRDDH